MTGSCKDCKYLVEIVGHPWNTPGSFTCGSICDVKCYGCTMALGDSKTVVLFDSIFAGCEMYTEDVNARATK